MSDFTPPEMTGLSMEPFECLHIIKADGTSVRFTEVVSGFVQNQGERLDEAVIRAAEEAVPDLQTVIYIPKETK